VRHILLLFATVGLLSAKSPLYERGEGLFFEKGCNGCHGTKAEGTHTYPALANRAKGYLADKLRRFRAKEAPTQMSQMMIPFAEPLSDDDIDALTTFLNEFEDTQTQHYNPAYEAWGDGGS